MNDTKIRHYFFTFISIHIFCWTIAPLLFLGNGPLDVMEGLAWGKEWQWGYDKHPFLAPWLTQLANLGGGGHALWTVYLLSQLCIAVCFYAMWRLSQKFLNPWQAFFAVLILEGVYFFNFTTPEFNPNIIMLPLWALSCWAFYSALTTDKWQSWCATGLWAGLAMVAKYYSAALLVCMLLLLLVDTEARIHWRKPGPYICAGIALLVMLPNIVWLTQHDFIAVAYALSRGGHHATLWWDHIYYPVNYIGQAFLTILPTLIIFIPLFFTKSDGTRLSTFDRRFLAWMAYGPFILTLLFSMVTAAKLRTEWATPLFSFTGLLLFIYKRPQITKQNAKRVVAITIGFFLLALIAFAVINVAVPYVTGKDKEATYPGQAMSMRITQLWHQRYHTRLQYVAGPREAASNVGFYSSDSPVVYFNWSHQSSPWVNEAQMRQSGAVFVWEIDHGGKHLPPSILQRFPNLQMLPVQYIRQASGAHLAKLAIGVAFLPPKSPQFTTQEGNKRNNG